jgi:uncharacterized protein (DUF58 family)
MILLKRILDRIPIPVAPLHEHVNVNTQRLNRFCSASNGMSSAVWMVCCRAIIARCSTATGVDFADLREYQPGDDIRHIDWNVTARMDSPYVRQFVEDRDVTAWFLLDLSPSMGFGPAARPKQLVLTEYVATLARLLVRSGNRVGAILYNRQVEQTIPPRGSRNQVLRLIRAILQQPGEAGGHATNLTQLARRRAEHVQAAFAGVCDFRFY